MYYVYEYLREDGTPYYIGKGKGYRAWSKNRSVPCPPKERINIIEDKLSESEALDLEKQLIKKYGRKDNKTGILRNMTDGGDGMSGWVPSDETKQKISESKTGKKINRTFFPKLSEEHKEKIGNAHRGMKRSDETKRKISEGQKGKKRKPLSSEHKKILSEKMKAARAAKFWSTTNEE